MIKALEKAESIRKTVKVYKKDFTLNMRDAETLYKCIYQSVYNHLNNKNKPALNIHIF